MLDHLVITKAFFGTPDPALCRARCGTSAVAFEELLTVMRWSCAAPAVAVWFAWEGRTCAEAQKRLQELH